MYVLVHICWSVIYVPVYDIESTCILTYIYKRALCLVLYSYVLLCYVQYTKSNNFTYIIYNVCSCIYKPHVYMCTSACLYILNRVHVLL